jgi:hypothetical protein
MPELNFGTLACLLCFICVKLDACPQWNDINRRCFKTKCSKKYLDLSKTKEMINLGYYVKRDFLLVYIGRLILL